VWATKEAIKTRNEYFVAYKQFAGCQATRSEIGWIFRASLASSKRIRIKNLDNAS
jgi:hypothetical protein